jgi:XTP/dITP diphosphohydrolase
VLGFPALADDSGLVVDALGGQLGIFSARYSGEGAGDEANIRKLLKAMEAVTDRRAAFECVIAIAVPRGPALIYEGRCEGEVARVPSGKSGFGYDPIFYYQPLKKTFAELGQEEKNRVSHRGKAMAQLLVELEKVMAWLKERIKEEPF